jgi:hypothetical protein
MRRGANSLLILTSVHFGGCNRAVLLSNVALLGKMAVLGKLAFLGKVAVLGKFTSWQSRQWRHHQHPAGIDAVAALSSSQMPPWRSCGPPFHGRQRPPLGPRPFWSLPSAIGAHPGLCPFVLRHFRVDLLDCLGFGSRPDGRVARLRSQQRPSFGLCLLGRPLGALDTQRGRLCFVIQNIARSLLLPVIPVPSGLVPLSGRHHPGESEPGAGVRLRHTSTFVTERTAPAPWSPMSHH